jgi:hypothetical protein
VTVRAAAVRRSRQAAPRPRLVKFFLTDEELADLDEAAGQAGLDRGAFAAEVTMAAARGRSARRCTAGMAVSRGPGCPAMAVVLRVEAMNDPWLAQVSAVGGTGQPGRAGERRAPAIAAARPRLPRRNARALLAGCWPMAAMPSASGAWVRHNCSCA